MTDEAMVDNEMVEENLIQEVEQALAEPQPEAESNQGAEGYDPELDLQSAGVFQPETAIEVPSAASGSAANVQPATFQPLSPSSVGNGHAKGNNLDLLLDVPVKVTVELGRTSMAVRNVLDLHAGSVLELDRLAGEVVDVFVNERMLAQGEVVVVDDKFGVRITRIVGDH